MENTAWTTTWGGAPVVAAVWGLIGLGALLLPLLLEKRLVALMFKRAQTAVAPAAMPPHEVPTGTPLQVVEVAADTAIAGAEQARAAYTARWIALFKQALWLDLAVVAGYIGCGAVAVAFTPTLADAAPVFVLGLVYLAACLARFFVHFPKFHTGDSQLPPPVGDLARISFSAIWRAAIGGLAGWFLAFMLAMTLLTMPALRVGMTTVFVLVAALVATAEFDKPQTQAGAWALLAAALLHVGATVCFTRWLQRHPGLKLLVLRVFGVDEKARFTFGSVLAVWEFFGSWFTVIDPSYWRHAHKLWSTGTIARLLGTLLLLMLVYMLGEDLARLSDSKLLSSLALPISGVVLLSFIGFRAWRGVDAQCIRGQAHMQRVLGGLERRPRGADVAFRNLTVPCHDDTWKIAVAEFSRCAHVVLMDLRGFSAARQGCAFEVNFLLDRLPIEQVVFLIDRSSDRELVGALIAECWKVLDVDSPNLANTAPEAVLYSAGDEDEHDVQGLLNLLLAVAARSAARP